jgi:hypothetical protein
MEFTLKFGRGGDENGPATNFFETQEAIVLVTLGPCVMAFVEFFYKTGTQRFCLKCWGAIGEEIDTFSGSFDFR